MDVPVAALLAEKREDFSEEEGDTVSSQAGSVAAFEGRTKRLVEAVKTSVSVDWRSTPVSLAILRKVDPANRKVIYAGAPSIGDIYDAAITWSAGERNVPDGFRLWSLHRGEIDPRPAKPSHVAPLGVIKFSKQIFLRNGKRPPGKKKEQMGLPAAETLKLFLDGAKVKGRSPRHRAERVLRLVLARRTMLIAEFVHAQRRGWDLSRVYDSYEALRTTTILGLLLYKLNRNKEAYMNDTAFRLGQLLAAADVVHAGYCADVRGGATPPSLLGNQFFVMAQTAPVKALSALARRWKPYDGWAKKNSNYSRPNKFRNDQGKMKRRSEFKADSERAEFDKGVAIFKAIWQSRRVADIAAELTGKLPAVCDDMFRAELLLGYMAGLPRHQKENVDSLTQNTIEEE